MESTSNEEPDNDADGPKLQIDGSNVPDFIKAGFGKILEATKCVNAMPSGKTRSLYSAYPVFTNIVESQSEQILETISKVIKLQKIKGNIQRRDHDEKFELLQECNDIMLERINSHLDEMSGIRKNPVTELVQSEIQTSVSVNKTLSGSWNENRMVTNTQETKRSKVARLLTARNIPRPQINFKIPVDNNPMNPFEPRIKYKPHSIKPLAVLAEYGEDGNIESYLHPYEFELTKFEPPQKQLISVQPKQPEPMEKTPIFYIDCPENLDILLKELTDVDEIAVDVEHHSYRTFQGITCLLQISTRVKDYIIDAILLRDELHQLNEIFTDPKIVKVFHGADLDVEWLQRDLSLYVVNMFDTHQAVKKLNYPRLSLAYLLKHFCQLDADKSYQLADWRIRPLPEELVLYARQDTHFLLYIYDMLKKELLQAANGQPNILTSVFQSSTEICKKRYVKPQFLPDTYMELYHKSKKVFDNRQLYALRELYAWRDKIARQEDESLGYILPNHMVLHVAETLPREMQGILACCNPIPPLVRQNLHVLHKFILRAREQPLVKPVSQGIMNRSIPLVEHIELSGHLHCLHDISHDPEFRDDLPCLIGSKSNGTVDKSVVELPVKNKAILSIMNSSNELNDTEIKDTLNKIKDIKFISPYARYLAILPFAEEERLAEQRKLAEEEKCRQESSQLNDSLKTEPEVSDEEPENLPLRESGKRKRDDKVIDSLKKPKIEKEINTRKKSTSTNESVNVQNIESSDEESIESVKDSTSFKTKSSTPINVYHNKRNENQFKRKSLSNNKTSQSSNQPIHFDYSKVDFNKFKGGSHSTPKPNNFPTKFHGKGKGRGNNKKFNKLFTFDKINKKK